MSIQITEEHKNILEKAQALVNAMGQEDFSYEMKENETTYSVKIPSKNPKKVGENRYIQGSRANDDKRAGMEGPYLEESLIVKVDKNNQIYQVNHIENGIETILKFDDAILVSTEQRAAVARKGIKVVFNYETVIKSEELMGKDEFNENLKIQEKVFKEMYSGKAVFVDLSDTKHKEKFAGFFVFKNFKKNDLRSYWNKRLEEFFEQAKNTSEQEISVIKSQIVSDVLKILLGAAVSVKKLQELGYNHLDLKFDNFMACEEDGFFDINVIDFGILEKNNNDLVLLSRGVRLFALNMIVREKGLKNILNLLDPEDAKKLKDSIGISENWGLKQEKNIFSLESFVAECSQILKKLDPSFDPKPYLDKGIINENPLPKIVIEVPVASELVEPMAPVDEPEDNSAELLAIQNEYTLLAIENEFEEKISETNSNIPAPAPAPAPHVSLLFDEELHKIHFKNLIKDSKDLIENKRNHLTPELRKVSRELCMDLLEAGSKETSKAGQKTLIKTAAELKGLLIEMNKPQNERDIKVVAQRNTNLIAAGKGYKFSELGSKIFNGILLVVGVTAAIVGICHLNPIAVGTGVLLATKGLHGLESPERTLEKPAFKVAQAASNAMVGKKVGILDDNRENPKNISLPKCTLFLAPSAKEVQSKPQPSKDLNLSFR